MRAKELELAACTARSIAERANNECADRTFVATLFALALNAKKVAYAARYEESRAAGIPIVLFRGYLWED